MKKKSLRFRTINVVTEFVDNTGIESPIYSYHHSYNSSRFRASKLHHAHQFVFVIDVFQSEIVLQIKLLSDLDKERIEANT